MHAAANLGAFKLGGRFGVSMPTGKMQPNPYVLGDEGRPHEHIQFGTGTFDPVLSADIVRSFDMWSLAAFAQTQLPLYRSPLGYLAGTRLSLGVVGTIGFGLKSPTFRLAVTGYQEFAER